MVSICVPVYNGNMFVEECINSILKQTFNDFELLISDDCSTDNTLELLEKYKCDDRVKIITSTKNVGWVKNCNKLISKTKYDYYCIIPHDDYIPLNYIEILFDKISKNADVVNCYPYIVPIRNNMVTTEKIIQKNIIGTNIMERIIDFIANHLDCVSFRGLVRKVNNDDLLYLNEGLDGNILADTFQIFQHAVNGKLIGADVPYYKRYHQDNLHSKWKLTLNILVKLFFGVYMVSKKYLRCDELDTFTKSSNIALVNKYGIRNFSNMVERSYEYIVMGGGIQGCCTALYLKKRGYDVCIIDKNSSLMNGASANHEGKIHLGFVYSNDKTFETSRKLLIDSLNFSKSIEYLIGKKVDWDLLKSNKFLYLVPNTSLVKEDAMDEFFEKIQKIYTELISSDSTLNYLGCKPVNLYKKIPIPNNFDKNYFSHCYETEEYAINQISLRTLLIEEIQRIQIPIISDNYIENVRRNHEYFAVLTDKNEYYSNKVINCLWEHKTKIDNEMFDVKCYDTNYRYKFGIISKHIQELETELSITIVNGPFGDFVNFPNYTYFSWYPCSMKGFCCSDSPPINWSTNSLIPDQHTFLAEHKEIFSTIFNKKFDFVEPNIIGGIIVGRGNKDIDDIDSSLHKRNDERIEFDRNYYTISTSKFTSGPYNAMLLKKFIDSSDLG